jgi:bifunctional UDP-N-acetylglucosamine pyrophosphorylase/glucosamine-1-phosphate N-acetyltransferase
MRRKQSQTTRTERRPLAVVVLAAGDGKRMRSQRPKVLHELAGKPLLLHVLDAARSLRPSRSVVVVGKGAKEVVAAVIEGESVVVQEPRLGTGHAVLQARRSLAGFRGDVLVLCGDVPLLRASTLTKLLQLHRRANARATVLSMIAAEPAGYGRIIRDGSGGLRIVEHADATPEERSVDEVNTGTYCFDSVFLFEALGKLGRKNAQREYYLTDLIASAAKEGRARCHVVEDADEGLGVNSRMDLACAEAALQERLIAEWMEKGVTFLDPSSAYLGADVRLGMDVSIGPSVVLLGHTDIGDGARIDGASRISDTVVGANAHVRWGVVADGARIATDARVGPYAHLRPGASLGDSVHIGNFVEVKNATLGSGTKANHLAYIGDATVGRDANIGAGTITCNYDGFRKHRTVIGDRVQIGSDTQLVAPVTLGADSYVAAGSTVSRDVPAGALAFNDKQQMTRPNWVRAFRQRATAAPATKRPRVRGKS